MGALQANYIYWIPVHAYNPRAQALRGNDDHPLRHSEQWCMDAPYMNLRKENRVAVIRNPVKI